MLSSAHSSQVSAFAHLVTVNNYSENCFVLNSSLVIADLLVAQPQLTDTMGIEAGRHPIKEKIMQITFVPNDVYATQQTRFQIITGCNMSGKSTYIRSVALMVIMAQIGC